jgi:HJR/Mrr/RecB family endonuclease
VISLGKKHLGNIFLAIKKLWLMSKFVFDTFVKWTKKKVLVSRLGMQMGKQGLKSPYEFQTWSNYLLKEEGKRETHTHFSLNFVNQDV